MSIVLNFKALKVACRLFLCRPDPDDIGIRRTTVQPVEHLLDFPVLALHQDLHRTVRPVPDPAGKAQTIGLFFGIGPEKHALDPTFDNSMHLFYRHFLSP